MRKLLLIGLLALWSLPSQAEYGGSRGTYLKFELEKVSITSIEFHGLGAPIRSKVLRISGLPSHVEMAKRPGAAASGMASGKRQHKPVVITKELDRSSVKLQEAFAGNRTLPHVVLNGRDKTNGKPVKLTLFGVKIKSLRQLGGTSAAGDADDRPTEEVAFYYNKIAFVHAHTAGRN